jgi:hypothetical protein
MAESPPGRFIPLVARLRHILSRNPDWARRSGPDSRPPAATSTAALVESHRRQQTGAAIVEGYRRHPQQDQELSGLTESTRALIEEEPW